MRLLLSGITMMMLFSDCKKNQEPDYTRRTSYFKNITEGKASDSVITCITFNIHLGFRSHSDPWNKDHSGATKAYLDSLAALILAADADIICLQEVPRNRYNAEIKNFIEDLAKSVGMNYAFGAHGYNDPLGVEPVYGEWGNAILSRFRITAIDNFENEYISVWQRRSILQATLQAGTELISVYSLHFLPSPQAAPNAVSYFSRNQPQKQIIMGDFNMMNIPELDSAGYVDVLGSDSANILSTIDLIFISEGDYLIREYGTVAGSVGLSDHPANACVLESL